MNAIKVQRGSRMGSLSRLLSPVSKWMPQSLLKRNTGLSTIRSCLMLGLLVGLVSLSFVSREAQAGTIAGTGGSTEITQIMNNVQLVQSYGQQVISYQNQLMQYATMIQNLKANPLGVLAPDLAKATSDATRLWSMGKNIAGSMSQIDKTFADTFKSPIAMNFSDKFSNWSNSSMDALKSAMLNAGLQRENFKSDGDALQTLVDRVSAADGAVGGLQALGSLNAAQIQESMKLRDLISQQQVAQNTYLAAQASKEQARLETNRALLGNGNDIVLPKASNYQN